MTGKIVSELKQRLDSITLVPAAGGKFELEVDGLLMYSKLQTRSFPDEDEILEQLRSQI